MRVIYTLNRSMLKPSLVYSDIERAHRFAGSNNRVIVCVSCDRALQGIVFVQCSVRERVMSRRLELRGRELDFNESLTKRRGLIFRSPLGAEREKKIYTAYSRGGQMCFKERQHGLGTRVDSLKRLRELCAQTLRVKMDSPCRRQRGPEHLTVAGLSLRNHRHAR